MKRHIVTAALMALLSAGFVFAQNPSCPRPDCPGQCQGNCPRNGNGNGKGNCNGTCARARNGSGQSGSANQAQARPRQMRMGRR
jgi:hypothetical protein